MCFSQSSMENNQFIVAKGNCGIPQFRGTEIVYDGTPEMMAQYAIYARSLGAKIIGGCCGTTHLHVKAMRDALENHTETVNFDLDKVIESLGKMTDGNIQMIKNYLDPNIPEKKVERKRRRRRRS